MCGKNLYILTVIFILASYMNSHGGEKVITLFLCGDVMTGRGIDQVLPNPADPTLHEPYMKSAQGYVRLAERANGPIQKPVDYAYIWGDALEELERVKPDLRIINLETSITTNDDHWKEKGIHYRMHPDNIRCLTAAKIDFCSLANNHILDWGYSGLEETLTTLREAGIQFGGAGRSLKEAASPKVLTVEEKGRVILFSCGSPTSGIPQSWAASEDKAGVNFISDFSETALQHIRQRITEAKKPGDIAVVSIHWGGNWGYEIPSHQIEFAHKMIDDAGVDIIHGHSSHHFKGIEVYKDKPIIYGSGDFINDYEGISGYEEYRDDLALMYFVSVDAATGKLVDFQMTPMQIRRFRLSRVTDADAQWIADIFNRDGKRFGTNVTPGEKNTLILQWN